MTTNVALYAGKSRPEMSLAKIRADFAVLVDVLGKDGFAGITENSKAAQRTALREHFTSAEFYQPRISVLRRGADAPVVWTSAYRLLASGHDFGCGGLGSIAPRRTTQHVILENVVTSLRVGLISTHMDPDGWPPGSKNNPTRREKRIRRAWNAHERRIYSRVNKMIPHVDVVVLVGDINRPGLFNFAGFERMSRSGVAYVGHRAGTLHAPERTAHTTGAAINVNSDHDLQHGTLSVYQG